jgi:hypothetical protein
VVVQAEADLYDQINRFREKRAGHIAISLFSMPLLAKARIESPLVEQ